MLIRSYKDSIDVVPLVGTWIETTKLGKKTTGLNRSFPSWERGLKHFPQLPGHTERVVVPLVGTWIETPISSYVRSFSKVVPLVGTWIETNMSSIASLGTRVVPLVGTWIETTFLPGSEKILNCRSPRGNVD